MAVSLARDYQEANRQLSEILKEEERSGENLLLKIKQGLYNGWIDWNHRFQEWLEQLLGVEVDTRLGWLLPVLLAALLLLAAVWIFRKTTYSGKVQKDQQHDVPSVEDEAFRWWLMAEARAKRKEYREGIRYLFRSVLASLEKQQILVRGDYKTNHEYRREVEQNRSDLLPAFTELVHQFDRIWYGRVPAAEQEYEVFRSLSAPLVKRGGPR